MCCPKPSFWTDYNVSHYEKLFQLVGWVSLSHTKKFSFWVHGTKSETIIGLWSHNACYNLVHIITDLSQCTTRPKIVWVAGFRGFSDSPLFSFNFCRWSSSTYPQNNFFCYIYFFNFKWLIVICAVRKSPFWTDYNVSHYEKLFQLVAESFPLSHQKTWLFWAYCDKERSILWKRCGVIMRVIISGTTLQICPGARQDQNIGRRVQGILDSRMFSFNFFLTEICFVT